MGQDEAAREGAALQFACLGKDLDAEALREISRQDNGFHLFGTLADAEAACMDGRVVALAADGAPQNLDPYLPPAPVTAAGGLVVRREGDETLLLVIYRRGAWDLPKGKLDAGETIEACAVREVREEVGIEALKIVAPAGTTVHGYPEDGRYLVKTTWWYFMETPERDFTPEAREGIEAVEWVPWREAPRRLGYATLREHVAGLEPPVR